jgi:hypothetical protein
MQSSNLSLVVARKMTTKRLNKIVIKLRKNCHFDVCDFNIYVSFEVICKCLRGVMRDLMLSDDDE